MHTAHIIWAWHTSLAGLSNMHCHCCPLKLAAVSKVVPTLKVGRVPCGFGSLVSGWIPSTLLQSDHENCVACQKFSLKYFREQLKIHETSEIKIHENLVVSTSIGSPVHHFFPPMYTGYCFSPLVLMFITVHRGERVAIVICERKANSAKQMEKRGNEVT